MTKRRQGEKNEPVVFYRESSKSASPNTTRRKQALPPDELTPWDNPPKNKAFPRGKAVFEHRSRSGGWVISIGAKDSELADRMVIGTIKSSGSTFTVISSFFKHPMHLLPGATLAVAKDILIEMYQEEKRKHSSLPAFSKSVRNVRGGSKWCEAGREGWNPS